MEESQKIEISNIFTDCRGLDIGGMAGSPELLLYNRNNFYFFIDYEDLDLNDVGNFLEIYPPWQNKRYLFNYAKDGFPISYSLFALYSKCIERFGEVRAKGILNLLYVCGPRFSQFHYSGTHIVPGGLIFHCDILVSDKLVQNIQDTFNLIFQYRAGKKEHLRKIQLDKGIIFEMDIISFYHYIETSMFIYKTKLLSDNDFEKGKEKHEVIGKRKPERIDNTELNPMHPDAPPFPIWEKRFNKLNSKE